MISSNELAVVEVLGVTPQDTININNYQRSLNSHSSDINSQLSSSQVDKSDEINDISTKNKPKRVTKSNKIKKEDIQDKSYIMELENQIGMLKSTIDLYKKTNEQRKNQNFSTNSTCSRDHTVFESCKVEPSCTHKCYSDLADKIQGNRLRAIETQMMQNMYISNVMHINLATQIRNSYSQIPPTYVEPSRFIGYSAPLPYYWPHAAYPNKACVYQPYRPTAQPHHYSPQSRSVNIPLLPNMGVRPPSFYQHQSPPVHYQHLGHTFPPHQPTGQIYQQPYAFPPAQCCSKIVIHRYLLHIENLQVYLILKLAFNPCHQLQMYNMPQVHLILTYGIRQRDIKDVLLISRRKLQLKILNVTTQQQKDPTTPC